MADDVAARLSDVVGRPGAVEVIEVLAESSKSRTELCAAVPLPKRKLERVLRTLAAEGGARPLRRAGELGSAAGTDGAVRVDCAR